jgi:hypothetical protein
VIDSVKKGTLIYGVEIRKCRGYDKEKAASLAITKVLADECLHSLFGET